ncbi:MAG: hypothetical protein JNL83_38420 [Myxococcales bacterium]|nr:hypothetical protein [Myxococcales bacterium]
MKRLRLAAPVLVMYWLMLLGGLALYQIIRMDDVPLRGLWIGAVVGTVLGHVLALRDVRSIVAVICIFLTACWMAAVLPAELVDKRLWMAFAPASLCAYLSLGDRASLVAFWFPAVLWMLSVLDRTGANATPDRSGVILLGGIAVLFVVYLRAREARRIRLWKAVAIEPIAAALPARLLREAPGRHAARAAWTVLVGGIAAGATIWLAPQLWQAESFDGGHVAIARPHAVSGRPCCPVSYDAPAERARVKEYFDVGRGTDELEQPQIRGIDCDVCDGGGAYAYAYGGSVPSYPAPTPTPTPTPYGGPTVEVPAGPYAIEAPYVPPSRTYSYQGHGHGEGPAPSAPGSTAQLPSTGWGPPDTGWGSPGSSPAPSTTSPAPASPAVPGQPRPQITPPAPVAPSPAPLVAQPPPPPVAPTPAPPAAPPVDDHAIPPPSPPPAVATTPQASGPPPVAHASTIERQARADAAGPSVVTWLAVLAAAALLVQLIVLALRPLRRALVVRHLRRPFWKETVDQQVSNSWQLALVGLRDAGWRATDDESPRELARRVGIDGVEQCATILERARHGLGVDADDLAEMGRQADVAYAAARARLGLGARAVSHLRWPLA